jgi:hypothetical protein
MLFNGFRAIVVSLSEIDVGGPLQNISKIKLGKRNTPTVNREPDARAN